MANCVNNGHYRAAEVLIVDHETPLLFKDIYSRQHWEKEKKHAEETGNTLSLKAMIYARRWAKLMQLLLDEGATFEQAVFIIDDSADLDDIRDLKAISYGLLIALWKYGNELKDYLNNPDKHIKLAS